MSYQLVGFEKEIQVSLMEEYSGGSSSSDEGRNCRRGHWRPAEDDKLRQLVEQFGPRNWNSIAEKIEGRTGKSCRLRWFNQLDPKINRTPFSEQEEEKLLASHRKFGNKWSLIARLFPGRTDNAVKNHYHVIVARQRRERPRVHTEINFHDLHDQSSDSNTIHIGNISQKYSELGHDLELQNPKKSDMFSISSSSTSSWTFNGSMNIAKSPSFDHFCLGRRDFINSGFSSFTKERSHRWDHNNSSLIDEGTHNFGATKICNDFESVDPRSFGFSNLGIGYYGSKRKIDNQLVRLNNDNTTTISKWQMGTQQEQQRDESTKHKDDGVPFIDFLGVGVSS